MNTVVFDVVGDDKCMKEHTLEQSCFFGDEIHSTK